MFDDEYLSLVNFHAVGQSNIDGTISFEMLKDFLACMSHRVDKSPDYDENQAIFKEYVLNQAYS